MILSKQFLTVVSGYFLFLFSTLTIADSAPSGLMCELLTQPDKTTIADFKPEFTWIVNSGKSQTAYRILVASKEELLNEGRGDAWDSEKVISNQSINIPYTGSQLKPARNYYWKVRTWNEQDESSDWSAVQKIIMADKSKDYSTAAYPLVITPVKPAMVKAVTDNHFFIDFGKDAFGFITLTVDCMVDNTQVIVHFGEKEKDGLIDREPGGTIRCYKVPVTLKSGLNIYAIHPPRDKRNTGRNAIKIPKSIGTICPFRYVEIESCPMPVSASQVIRHTVNYPFDETASSFSSSNPVLNKVWDLCKYSIKATSFCGIYVDGDRERIPYEADAYINQLCHYCVDREYSMARASHEYLLRHPTWPTEWKQHSILMAWQDYMYTGNIESLEANYEVLKKEKLLDRFAEANGLLNTAGQGDIVDWPENERDNFDFKPVNAVVNAFHYKTLILMEEISKTLGRQNDAAAYADVSKKFYQSYQKAFFNSQTGLYIDSLDSTHSSLHANMFALAFDLVPHQNKKTVAEFVKSKGMACSVYGAQYLLEALYKSDMADYALNLMTAANKRSWTNMMKAGSTITLEAWDLEFKPNLDWNHAWGAAPANIIPRYLMGVRPIKPGFEKVLIEPKPGSLTTASIVHPTIRGPIKINMTNEPGQSISLKVSIPSNMTAQIILPKYSENNFVTIDGTRKEAESKNNALIIDELKAGTYHITSGQTNYNSVDIQSKK